MGKHTPGPWMVGRASPWSVWCAETQIASCRWYDHDYPYEGTFAKECADSETAHANALLIAAAPDLLAALREAEREARFANLAEDGTQKPNTPAARVIAICRAAIAKAEGA